MNTHSARGITYVEEEELRAMAAGRQTVHRPWSPFDIRLMLHFYASPTERFEQAHAPIYTERLKAFVDAGLIKAEWETTAYIATEKGRALVDMWCETPTPVVRYVDPRHG